MDGQLARNRPLDPEHYYHRSQRPLQALILLLPLLLFYELGTLYFATNPATGEARYILARSLLAHVLDTFGAAGSYLPGLLVVVVLLAWHVAKRDPLEFDWRLYLAMAAESVALAIPLLMFALLWGRQSAAELQAVAAGPEAMSWQAQIVFGIGAGVYEELVFRLMAITLLHLLLADLIGLRPNSAAAVAVGCSAVLFSAYHFNAENPFRWMKFVFYALAGAYLGVLFVLRGFGIVVATHAFYDIFYVALDSGILARHHA